MVGVTELNQMELYNLPQGVDPTILQKVGKDRNAISIVIPAYNEENRIRNTLRDLLSKLKEEDQIIVVFDGNDHTPEVVRSFGDRVELLLSNRRLGKGGAILFGFQNCRNETVGFIDADNAVPVEDVMKLAINVDSETPCVIGSRWVRSSRIVRNEPLLNVFTGRIFHYIVYLVLGIKAKDTQCGAKFFKSEIIREIIPKITIKSRMIDIALLYHVKLLDKKILEMGVTWRHSDETRLPILKAIPLMLATVIALKISHHHKLKLISHAIRKFGESISHN